MKKVKAVIFDFNGVLWWDSHLHEKAWKDYAKKVRGAEFTDEEMHTHMHGRTNRDILEYLLGHKISKDELLLHTEGKESIYRQFCLNQGNNFKLAPGAVEFLDYLKVSNIPRTIATASEINNLQFFWNNLNLVKWFKFNDLVYDDGLIEGKPRPDIYLKAIDKLRLRADECLVVEDSKSGIESAHNAKVGTIVAIGPIDKKDYLLRLSGVDYVVSDFYELLVSLKKQFKRAA